MMYPKSYGSSSFMIIAAYLSTMFCVVDWVFADAVSLINCVINNKNRKHNKVYQISQKLKRKLVYKLPFYLFNFFFW